MAISNFSRSLCSRAFLIIKCPRLGLENSILSFKTPPGQARIFYFTLSNSFVDNFNSSLSSYLTIPLQIVKISPISQGFQTLTIPRTGSLLVVTEHPKIYLHAHNYMDSNALAWHLLVFHTSPAYYKLGRSTAMWMCLWVLKSKAKLCKTLYKPPNFSLLRTTIALICLSHDPSLLNYIHK